MCEWCKGVGCFCCTGVDAVHWAQGQESTGYIACVPAFIGDNGVKSTNLCDDVTCPKCAAIIVERRERMAQMRNVR